MGGTYLINEIDDNYQRDFLTPRPNNPKDFQELLIYLATLTSNVLLKFLSSILDSYEPRDSGKFECFNGSIKVDLDYPNWVSDEWRNIKALASLRTSTFHHNISPIANLSPRRIIASY